MHLLAAWQGFPRASISLPGRGVPGLTRQLPLLGAHFARRQDHGHAAKVAVADAHEQREDAGPGWVAQGGRAAGVDAQDEEGDEDHTQAGAGQQVGAPPVHGQSCQDLRGAKRVGPLPPLTPPPRRLHRGPHTRPLSPHAPAQAASPSSPSRDHQIHQIPRHSDTRSSPCVQNPSQHRKDPSCSILTVPSRDGLLTPLEK